MADLDDHQFEARIERLFSAAPNISDNESFATRISARVDRGQVVRRVAMTVAGLGGGLTACFQIIQSPVVSQVQKAEENSTRIANTASSALQTTLTEVHQETITLAKLKLSQVAPQTSGLLDWASQPTLFWSVSLVLILVAGLLAARIFDEV